MAVNKTPLYAIFRLEVDATQHFENVILVHQILISGQAVNGKTIFIHYYRTIGFACASALIDVF